MQEKRFQPGGFGRVSGQVLPGSGNTTTIGEMVKPFLDSGPREKKINGERVRKLTPTQSERFNRSLAELKLSAYKIHSLLWKWRGAPARGQLPFFTIHSLAKFCRMTRPTVRAALRELIAKGWITRLEYNRHEKNSLYRLRPIRDVPKPAK